MIRILSLFIMTACSRPSSATANSFIPSPPKILTITVHPDGNVSIGKDTVYIDDLAKEVKERLWKSYLGTGKMYDLIKVKFAGEVLMGVKGSSLDAIKEGQDKALRELCIQKYKKPWDKLNSTQKAKVKKQFPVLFQELHW